MGNYTPRQLILFFAVFAIAGALLGIGLASIL
jgi:hypothetical protein